MKMRPNVRMSDIENYNEIRRHTDKTALILLREARELIRKADAIEEKSRNDWLYLHFAVAHRSLASDMLADAGALLSPFWQDGAQALINQALNQGRRALEAYNAGRDSRPARRSGNETLSVEKELKDTGLI